MIYSSVIVLHFIQGYLHFVLIIIRFAAANLVVNKVELLINYTMIHCKALYSMDYN